VFQIAEDFTAKPVEGEYWVPLVQKAFAKFFGSYYKMNGGVTPTALYNLTGGLILNIENYTGRPYLLNHFLSTIRMEILTYVNYNLAGKHQKSKSRGWDLFDFMMRKMVVMLHTWFLSLKRAFS